MLLTTLPQGVVYASSKSGFNTDSRKLREVVDKDCKTNQIWFLSIAHAAKFS